MVAGCGYARNGSRRGVSRGRQRHQAAASRCALKSCRCWARLKIQALQQELRLERIKKYGAQSETLSSLQLELLDSEPGVSGEEVEAEATREPLLATPPRARKPHPGRQTLPKNLPRITDEVAVCRPQLQTLRRRDYPDRLRR